jgi:uncharacterized protein
MIQSNGQGRIKAVDALRGLALLGILLANIPFAEQEYSRSDRIAGLAVHLLIDKKFITIFSMLFGFGFYMLMKKAEESGKQFCAYFMKRMLVLFLIGCMHAYLLWFGDILRDYALCGMALLLVYKWRAKRILVVGIIFCVVLTGLVFIANGALGLQEYSYDRAIVRELPVTSSYSRYLVINATIDPFVNFIQDSPITLVFCFGNMLLGLWMARVGFFQRYSSFHKQRKWLITGGIVIGLPASYVFWMITTGRLELNISLLWLPFAIIMGLLLQSLCYISAFIQLYQYGSMRKFPRLFAPVGKMALTNYLLQTLFYLFIFFHWTNGLCAYGKLSQSVTYLIGLLLYGIQVAISHWWMARHQEGPLEWCWRKMVRFNSFTKKYPI